MASMSSEEKAASFRRLRSALERQEKVDERFRSLPEEKQLAFLNMRREQREKWQKKNPLPGAYFFSFSDKGCPGFTKCVPYPNNFPPPPPSDSEYSQYLKQDRFMELCKVAIKSYNIDHHSNFEAVAVEKLNVYGRCFLHHVLTFTARDAKDPSAASLTFEADVEQNVHTGTKAVYCIAMNEGER